MPFRIVNIGDSVPWGQGLAEGDKYDVLLKGALLAVHPEGVTLERFAHSGAIIGPGLGRTAPDGEVPVPCPTVLDQLHSIPTPGTVDLALVDGGINDVGVATILNPLAIVPPLTSVVHKACHDAMLALLRQASAAFTKPTCRILVTEYYPILSDLSDPLGIAAILHTYGLRAPDFVDETLFHNVVVDRCEEFFAASNSALSDAVRDAQDARITFVPSGFTDANAMFVPGTTFLWGLDLLNLLGPEDEVAAQRRPQCNLEFNGLLDFAQREQCYRVSAGHPNRPGAKQYEKQLLRALGLPV
jgi:hypothetical protein